MRNVWSIFIARGFPIRAVRNADKYDIAELIFIGVLTLLLAWAVAVARGWL